MHCNSLFIRVATIALFTSVEDSIAAGANQRRVRGIWAGIAVEL
jgi:hypothetical protein